MFNEDKMQRKIKGKGKRKKAAKSVRKKKVNYSWLSDDKACRCKAYMAYVSDHKIKRFHRLGNRKAFFEQVILPRTMRKFKSLYKKVKTYYNEHGNTLTKEHFHELLYARFTSMYNGQMRPTKEHPTQSKHTYLKESYFKYKQT